MSDRNVLTQHNNNERTGAYLHESFLTQQTVGSDRFRRLFERNVKGDILAQILYVHDVPETRLGTKNLFFAATSTNEVYAFDADDTGTGWFQIHPETVFDRTHQRITAVSRGPGNLDLFVIGFDAVWTTFWNTDVGWNPGGWFPIHPETVFDHTTQRIAAVSRAPGNL